MSETLAELCDTFIKYYSFDTLRKIETLLARKRIDRNNTEMVKDSFYVEWTNDETKTNDLGSGERIGGVSTTGEREIESRAFPERKPL